MDKGTVSNLTSALLLVVSILLPDGAARALVFSAAIFAFSGGVTNWLAVKMLFDRIPGLIGSGVIPARFREIRSKVKDLIVEHFFDEEYLKDFFSQRQGEIDWQKYLKRSSNGGSPMSDFVERQWEKLTSADVVQPMIDSQIDKLTNSSVGGLLVMVGLDKVRPAVNQFVSGFIASMQEKVLAVAAEASPSDLPLELDEEAVVRDLRENVGVLLETKLQQLHAADVKRMMEDVIRQHLGWLVVWGNVFGGLLGVVAFLLRGRLGL